MKREKVDNSSLAIDRERRFGGHKPARPACNPCRYQLAQRRMPGIDHAIEVATGGLGHQIEADPQLAGHPAKSP